MKIIITKPTFVVGEPAAPGDKLTVTDEVGRQLIIAGKAVEQPKGKSAVAPAETADAGPTETPETPAKKK